MKDSENMVTYTLTPEEVELMLVNKFGGRIQPVDSAMVAHQKQKQLQRQATLETYKARFAKANKSDTAVNSENS